MSSPRESNERRHYWDVDPETEECWLPALGEQLFVRDPNNPDAFAWLHGAGWYEYVIGYRDAARLLVKEIESGGGVLSAAGDHLVYPAVFLYRQYLELQMKNFIKQAGSTVGVADDCEQTHDLVRLWKTCRKICEAAWPRTQAATLDAVGDQIRQLDRIDPGSFAFRYATKKDRSRSLPEDLRSFNVGLFAWRIEKIGNFIEGVETGIDEIADMQADIAAEARANWAEYNDPD